MRKTFLFTSFFIFLSLFGQKNNVVVNGKTNLNTFKCFNESFNAESNAYSFAKNQLPNLQLEVANFDCKNRMMTRDLRKTLQADKYPKMYVKFLSFKKISNQQYDAKVEVRLIDKTRYYNTSFYPIKNTFVGREYVRFSDFGLKPPTKMGGLIAVEDQLNLVLTLNNY